MGRPTDLTPETHKIITSAIAYGGTYEASAHAGGVSYDTFNNWMKRGEAELVRRDNPRVKEDTQQWQTEQRFVEFFKAIKKAKGDRQIRWLEQIEKAATGGAWQAAAWKLERTEPENFGRQKIDIEHSGEVKIKGYAKVSPDDWD